MAELPEHIVIGVPKSWEVDSSAYLTMEHSGPAEGDVGGDVDDGICQDDRKRATREELRA